MSKKSGPARKFPLEQLTKLFEQYEEDIVNAGKILRPTDPFWKEFKKQYKINSTEKAIYTDAIKWFKKSECENKEEDDLVRDFDDILENETQVSSNGSSYESSDESFSCVKSDIQFSIKLTYNMWKLIKPESRSYHRRADKTHKSGVREFLVMKPGFWSNVFVDKIAEHPKNIICEWSFKRARVASNGKYYVMINADCIICRSKLFAILKTKPIEDEEVTFTCVVKGFNKTCHEESNKKVRVTGSMAQNLATSKKPAIVLHRELSAKSG